MNIRKTKVKDKKNIEPIPDNRIKKKCSICGKEFFGQGFGGHMWNRHQLKVGPKIELQQLKSKLEETLKLIDHKDCISKSDVVACPKCKAASWARDWTIVTPGKVKQMNRYQKRKREIDTLIKKINKVTIPVLTKILKDLESKKGQMGKGTFILGIPIKKTRLSLKRRQEILRRAGYPEVAEKLSFDDMARKKEKIASQDALG